jgi:formate hydrogenlyase transcriptional activator
MHDEATLRLVIEGTVSETGTDFFRALVRNLATALGTTGAWVTEYLPVEQKLRALAMWLNGGFVEHYEYSILGTACQAVVESRSLIHIPERLIELFPLDSDLIPLGAVSYLGAPLLDTDGSVMGHLSVLDTKIMPKDPEAISLFQIFAARAAAEHRRLKIEQEARAREEQLATLLETAMDAILVLDSGLRVVRINQAATRLFGCTSEDLMGETIYEFLVKNSADRLETFVRDLAARPEGKQQLWVPQDFVARRWDHSVFPAEATLSRFENRRQAFYTLILRNVDERVEAERQIQLLTQETEYLREAVRDVPGHDDLLGRSDCMQAVFGAIKQVASLDTTVLITGETGTGKELVARSIHRASPRASKPLVLVNCAAIPANLIESEFFGHERGAFTGAVARREGRFALANGGTLFLDEIGELPLELQPKLLRVLQEGEFEPLGGARTIKVNVRVVAATHRDLKQMVAEGRFREDLYFRLNVFPIHVPALRERGRDVEQLAGAFVQRYARRMGKRIGPLSVDQLKRLRGYDWPGNVRELQNVIERSIILTSGAELQLERAMSGFVTTAPAAVVSSAASTLETNRVFTAREFEQIERENVMRALATCQWRVSGDNGAARLLGIAPSTLSSRIKALGIRRPSS